MAMRDLELLISPPRKRRNSWLATIMTAIFREPPRSSQAVDYLTDRPSISGAVLMSSNTITGATAGAVQPSSSLQSNWRNVLGAAAKALGMRASSVSAQLRTGSSLSSIAQSRGVPQQALTSAIASALSPSTQAAATNAERQKIATSIANRVGGGSHSRQGAGGSDAANDPLPADIGGDDASVSVSITSADVLIVLTAGATSVPSGSTIDQLA
jgi:hypothetical protein